jgi:hypothetical protein
LITSAKRLLQQYLPEADLVPIESMVTVLQELHPMVANWVSVILRTRIETRPIARHKYPMEASIV